MKQLTSLALLLITCVSYGQIKTNQEKFRQLEPTITLGIWDKENSTPNIQITILSYDDIPKSLDFRGTVVEALTWVDAAGRNILIQTVTGHFNWKGYDDNQMEYTLQDKSELYAYLFQKKDLNSDYQKVWRIYDYTECNGLDWFTGFSPKATTITDLNKNGIAEVSIPYVSICRGGMDPGIQKIIFYEGHTKYALRGETMLMCDTEDAYGGTFIASDNLNEKKEFMAFLTKQWDATKCENDKYW